MVFAIIPHEQLTAQNGGYRVLHPGPSATVRNAGQVLSYHRVGQDGTVG